MDRGESVNLIVVSLLVALANPQDPNWMADYGQALQTAREVRKPLLVVLDKTPHEHLRPVSHRTVAPLLKPYVLCRIDISTPYGQKVANAFRATSFPHTAVIDNTGATVLARRQGPLTESAWTTLLTTYQAGRRPLAAPSLMSVPQQCFT
jgi:hypothetical protein